MQFDPVGWFQDSRSQFNRYKTWSQSHWLTRQFNQGLGESFGWEFDKRGQNRGFLGMKGRQSGRPFSGLQSELKLARKGGWKGIAKFGGGMALRGAGILFSASYIAQGFQEGGITGGLSATVESAAMARLWHFGGKALMNPLGIAAMATVGTAVAGYKFLQASQKNLRNLQKLEMVDNQLLGATRNAGAYTMRQRSLQALQNTHINGRMSMGNEGFMHHSSYRGG
jgi:hypothetical protein